MSQQAGEQGRQGADIMEDALDEFRVQSRWLEELMILNSSSKLYSVVNNKTMFEKALKYCKKFTEIIFLNCVVNNNKDLLRLI